MIVERTSPVFVSLLRSIETFVYRNAYYIAQDQTLAIEITEAALLEAGRRAVQLAALAEHEQRAMLKQLVMKCAIPVILRCSRKSKSRIG